MLGLSIGPQRLVHEAPLVFVKGALHPPGVVGRGFRRSAGNDRQNRGFTTDMKCEMAFFGPYGR